MWPPLGRPSPRVLHTSFACSSFKDLPLLSSSSSDNDDDDNPPPTRPISARTIFHRVRLASSLLRNWKPQTLAEPIREIRLAGAENRVVVYFTSLRVVRQTFDACHAVQSILTAFRVAVDERDVSVSPAFLDELLQILGIGKESLTLPKVFIAGRFVGGADEIRNLYETGELKNLVADLQPAMPRVCEACGGFRFILCADCDGSHKVFSGKGGFRSCPGCYEDGLIKCPACYPTALVSP